MQFASYFAWEFLYRKMAKKKKKHNGHYCKVCGCCKSNESFTGKGHAQHICKECQSLPKDEQADMMRCNEVERAAFHFPMRRQDWELLEKYAKKYKDRESGQYAQEMLDMKRSNYAPEADDEEADDLSGKIYEIEETPFSDLDEDNRIAVEELLEDNINEFMIHKDYIPEGKDLQDMADWVLKETNDAFYLKVVPDDAYRKLIDDTVRKLVREWKDDGMEIKTYTESLTVMETERLIIRKITRKDMGALLALMGKPEVMYAWEHGFEKKEVRQWLNRQLTRYRKDGYGYFAVILKENNKFIGQAGLMKSVIDGNNTVELGYMLDNTYWHHGYATEVARRCLQYAFEELGLQKVCCSIRPENTSSLRVAEAIGMIPCGSHTIVYNGKEMPHLLYKAEKYN
ncbi:GNAT family N-acetyltransferase [Phocaeicola vulgatus]|uniref:GNAT family N-acetyltransferase n=2 Tax=Bacteroidaceae TaxID=815 RepID=UPI0034A42FB8